MVVAVHPDACRARRALRRHGVELADIGRFTGDGVLVVRSRAAAVLELSRRSCTTGARSGR